MYAFRPEENLAGLGLLFKALEFDPTFAPALANAAWCLEQRFTRAWAPFGEDDAALAVSLARRAIGSEGNDATALVMAGFVLIMVGRDYDVGLDAVRRALDLNPGSGVVALFSGFSLIFAGDPEDALVQAKRAMALNPLDPGLYLYLGSIGFAHLLSGRPEQAIEFGRRSMGLYPHWDSIYWLLIGASCQLDRMDEARRALAKLSLALARTDRIRDAARASIPRPGVPRHALGRFPKGRNAGVTPSPASCRGRPRDDWIRVNSRHCTCPTARPLLFPRTPKAAGPLPAQSRTFARCRGCGWGAPVASGL